MDDAVLVNAGFDQNIFGVKKKYESSGYTPDRTARVSIKEGAQNYVRSGRAVCFANLSSILPR